MKLRQLGSADIEVSEVCLGSMTWGSQNTESEAHQQIEYAISEGVNFIDTAEMYAVPPSEQTAGLTEQYIGRWLQKNPGKRQDIVLATKATGAGVPWVRGGEKLSGRAVKSAIEGSLQRLKTDYIDLYQLHWFNRPGPHFGQHWPGMIDYSTFDAEREREEHLDILQALNQCVQAGMVRHCGISNDTPWGVKEYLSLAKQHGLPKMVSLQNEFSLLHHIDAPHVFETCALEQVAYLPWSPLAGGALSGKYRGGAKPPGCRWTMQQRNGIFRNTSYSHQAIEALYNIAQEHGLSLTQLSLAWVYQYKGVTSTIIGATSLRQLEEDLGAYHTILSEQILSEIGAVIRQFPVPF